MRSRACWDVELTAIFPCHGIAPCQSLLATCVLTRPHTSLSFRHTRHCDTLLFPALQNTTVLNDPTYLATKTNQSIYAQALKAFLLGNNAKNRTYDAIMHTGDFTGAFAQAR